jgi:hypothetical protein
MAMKRVLAYDTDFEAQFAAGLLEDRGIPCEVREGQSRGGVPVLPELWVLRDDDIGAASEALEERPNSRGFGWSCPNCRNENEAAFDACWSCGAARPGPGDP